MGEITPSVGWSFTPLRVTVKPWLSEPPWPSLTVKVKLSLAVVLSASIAASFGTYSYAPVAELMYSVP